MKLLEWQSGDTRDGGMGNWDMKRTEAIRKQWMGDARRASESDGVPLGFEARVMAEIRARAAGEGVTLLAAMDPLAFWATGLWRAAVGSLAVTAVAGLLNWSSVPLETGVDLADSGVGEPWETMFLESLESPGDSPW